MNKDFNDLFWDAAISDMKCGYVLNENNQVYSCLFCGEEYEEGMVYQTEEKLYSAKRAMENHIKVEHGSAFEFLINMDKKYTGLTDHQKLLMKMFFDGLKDKEIVELTGGGSTSTIRNLRFMLREKEKQAKIFLCIMELLNTHKNGKKNSEEEFISIHRGATMVDERYAITEKERQDVLSNYFTGNKLKNFPVKEKKKIVVLQHILKVFDLNSKYTETEVNEKFKAIYEDFASIRRYMIEYGFMERTRDCKEYWIKK